MPKPGTKTKEIESNFLPTLKLSHEGDWLVLTRSQYIVGLTFFFIVWLGAWTVGTAAVVREAAVNRDAPLIILALVISFFWLIGFTAFIWTTFGRESLRIGPEGVEYSLNIIVPIRQRQAPLDEVRGAYETHGKKKSKILCVEIGLSGGQEPIRLVGALLRSERQWLIDVFNRRLEELTTPTATGAQPTLSSPENLASSVPIQTTQYRIVRPPDAPPTRPEKACAILDESDPNLTFHSYSDIHWVRLGCGVIIILAMLSASVSLLYVFTFVYTSPFAIFALIFAMMFIVIMLGQVIYLRNSLRGSVLGVSEKEIWTDASTLFRRPMPVPSSEVKAVVISDPTYRDHKGAESSDYPEMLSVVFLNNEAQELLIYSVNTLDEAEWIAATILHRYPWMYDPSVFEKKLPEAWWASKDV